MTLWNRGETAVPRGACPRFFVASEVSAAGFPEKRRYSSGAVLYLYRLQLLWIFGAFPVAWNREVAMLMEPVAAVGAALGERGPLDTVWFGGVRAVGIRENAHLFRPLAVSTHETRLYYQTRRRHRRQRRNRSD